MNASEISLVLGIAATVIIVAIFASSPPAHAEKEPFVFPAIGSPIASAMVIYDSREVALDTKKIADIINKSSEDATAKAEDVTLPGGMVFPLVRVMTPVSFVVAINDSPDSVAEIREMADEAEKKQQLPKELIAKLRRCNARLDVSSTDSQTSVTEKAIIVDAKTDLDPTSPAVQKLLHTLQDSTQGLTLDCVHGGWLMR